MTAVTSDPLVAPVSASDAADYIGCDSSDPLLPGILMSATDAVIQHLGLDLLKRSWVLTHWDWPAIGTITSPNLGSRQWSAAGEIALPFANLVSVTSVTVYGTTLAADQYDARGNRLRFDTPSISYDSDDAAIIVEYDAGYGENNSDVPDSIKQAILMVASFLFEHRGSCDATGALTKSGAQFALQPHVKPDNLVSAG